MLLVRLPAGPWRRTASAQLAAWRKQGCRAQRWRASARAAPRPRPKALSPRRKPSPSACGARTPTQQRQRCRPCRLLPQRGSSGRCLQPVPDCWRAGCCRMGDRPACRWRPRPSHVGRHERAVAAAPGRLWPPRALKTSLRAAAGCAPLLHGLIGPTDTALTLRDGWPQEVVVGCATGSVGGSRATMHTPTTPVACTRGPCSGVCYSGVCVACDHCSGPEVVLAGVQVRGCSGVFRASSPVSQKVVSRDGVDSWAPQVG